MYNISYVLKHPKSKDESLILLFVTIDQQRLRVSTREKIQPVYWDKKKKQIRWNKVHQFKNNDSSLFEKISGVQIRLDNLSTEINKYIVQQSLTGDQCNPILLKNHIVGYLNPKTRRVIDNTVESFLEVFIDEAFSGYRKKANGKPYRKASIVCYQNLLSTLLKYESKQKRKLLWDDIDKSMYLSFIKWHETNGYSTNYCGRHIKDLKSIMRIAYEEKIHSNTTYRDKYFSVPKEVEKKIPLSINEVDKLKSLSIIDNYHLDLSRNIFVLGCYIGLRVSDIKKISPDKITESTSGKVLTIKTEKTGAVVSIPLNKAAIEILSQYDFILPKFSEQVVNRHLKILAKAIGLSPKRAERLSMHYSRATFAKIAYEIGIPSLFIMKITGHTSEQNFLRYINIAPEEAVKEFRKFNFFK